MNFDIDCRVAHTAVRAYSHSWQIAMNYENRKQHLISTLDFNGQRASIGRWLDARPAMKPNSGNINRIARYTSDEVLEAQAEAIQRGTMFYSPEAEAIEAADIWFFLGSYISSVQIEIDTYEARRNVNGYGRRSDIFDNLAEVSGNFSRENFNKDILHFLRLWLAYLASMPEGYEPDSTINKVMYKNGANYFEAAFTNRDPETGRLLNPDETDTAFDHAKRSIRLIRNFIKYTLKLDRSRGLLQSDYQKYLPLINNFKDATGSYAALKIQLYLDHNLPVPVTELAKT